MPLQRLRSDAPLYHWAPAGLREQILAQGLRISQPSPRGASPNPDGTPWLAPYLCFGVSPIEAWAYSHTAPSGLYDLWQISRGPETEDKVVCRRDGGRYILEVRIHNDINRSRLFRVGERRKEER